MYSLSLTELSPRLILREIFTGAFSLPHLVKPFACCGAHAPDARTDFVLCSVLALPSLTFQLYYKVSDDRAVTVVDAKQALPEDDYLLALQQRRAEELAACGALSELPVEEDGELLPLDGDGEAVGGRSRPPRRKHGAPGGAGPGYAGRGGSEAAEAAKRARKEKKEKAKAAKAELEAVRKAADAAAGGARTSTGGHSGADDGEGGD